MTDSFGTRTQFTAGGRSFDYFSLKKLEEQFPSVAKLPYAQKILLENLLRHEDGANVTADDIKALANWDAKAEPDTEIAFTPARVVLQDFTGVPAVVDLAAMRDAMKNLGGSPAKINPQSPAELVIDHSVMVDEYGSDKAFDLNAKLEFNRNKERYAFLRWGQGAFDNFKVVPPDTGIVHQVNLEYLARVVFGNEDTGLAYPDTLVGTDSHTTMINGVGVLGWGVGGIEAEAAMLGQPITMLIPQVIGFKLTGKLAEGTTATDLVLTVTEMLRAKGVVGKFVEFYGDGLADLALADRATIANMAPEYGATCGIFPVDEETIRYMELTGRDAEQLELTREYAKAQGLWREAGQPDANYTDSLELDLSTVQPSLAGPKRPQDRVLLSDMQATYKREVKPFIEAREEKAGKSMAEAKEESEGGIPSKSVGGTARVNYKDAEFDLHDGSVVIAAITSCTNTSNPAVMIGAGLLARNAINKGMTVKPWVKTSLAPGSKVVTEYLEKAGLDDDLDQLGFNLVGYGCTTCIGNSGPLPDPIGEAVRNHNLNVASVLSGNRNFEGRVHGDVRMNFLASPPLVVAYALAGTIDTDLTNDPLGQDADGNDVFLADLWPSQKEIYDTIGTSLNSEMFKQSYGDVFAGDSRWQNLDVPEGEIYAWDEDSTYVQNPPYFEGMTVDVDDIPTIKGARCLAKLGDSITTDHISPAGAITQDSPAGQYLQEQGVKPADFNSYGSRRGNHEVMMRGTFANVRLRNQLAPGTEGGWTRYQPEGREMFIYDAAMKYKDEGTPLVILAGKEYGTGSSRDWAAKGTLLLGVKAVIAESFERIHRSNLVGMGVLPLQFNEGDSHESLGLDGSETFDLDGLAAGAKSVHITATKESGETVEFDARVRIDTPKEWDYYQNGGILHYVLRQLAKAA
ncbi:aconitate hydratase AcnA [Salinisphaera hydrothermalis]|uniref:Aconitate hydratase n=1 Tax=Salinisphaera hydrothermalis (strain C41B8) TaxID=1304275 RepID=A0A084IQG7_SALHC|nr:aconitate hydratase AcnA [Salinisphaera hydrothermalis]KEZ78951.1 aconitate hydratase [Salinisphaera hydrothermalis C41B8]